MLTGGASNNGEEAPSSTNSKSNRFVDIYPAAAVNGRCVSRKELRIPA